MPDIKERMDLPVAALNRLIQSVVDLYEVVEGIEYKVLPECVHMITAIENAGAEVLDLRQRLATKDNEIVALTERIRSLSGTVRSA